MTGLWSRQSIGIRLVAAHAASVGLVLLIFSLGVSLLFWNNLEQGLHRELGREFEAIEGLIDVSPTGGFRWAGDERHDEADYEGEAIAAEVWASQTELLVRTKAAERWAQKLGPAQFRWDSTGFGAVDIGEQRVHFLQGQHQVGGRPFVIRIFRSDTPARQATATLMWALLVGLTFALVLAVATTHRVVSRLFLKPLARMAEHAARISVQRSGDPVLPIANPKDELGQLGVVFNDVLGRYDRAISRVRRFSADASHELRTPLTSIRSVGEVCLRSDQTQLAYRDAIGSILEEVEGLSRLLDSLILLSKADEGKASLFTEPRSILALVEEVKEVMAVLSEPKEQVLSVTGDGSLQADVDPAVLRLALINLLDNAIKFGLRHSTVEVEVSCGDREVWIDVHNDGDAIAAEDQELVFDRFYRIDGGHSRSTGGSGLGLSVARWAVEAHDGSVRVENDTRPGVTFRIRLPRTREGRV